VELKLLVEPPESAFVKNLKNRAKMNGRRKILWQGPDLILASAPLLRRTAVRRHRPRRIRTLPIFYLGGMSVILLLSAVLFCGCVTKSKAQAQAQAAYLAGQNAALQQQQTQTPGVMLIGPVQNPDVPWVAGLTLAQAIATANYLGQHDPKEIIITRQGESAKLTPKWLLNGADVPLEPGDTITIH
jgi:hypothetical protein